MIDRESDSALSLLAGGAALVIVTVALVAQFTLPLNVDAQWLLIAAERVLGGQRLYREILEINPPLVVWLDVPIVWLAHATGAAAGTVLRLAIVLGAIGAAWAVCALLGRPSFGMRARIWAFPTLLLVLLVLPGGAFAQREQLITMLLLPYLAVEASRLDGRKVGTLSASAAGVAAGVAISLKPHFVLVWLLVSGYRSITQHLRPRLTAEDAAIVGTGTAYLLAIVVFAPDFLSLARTYAAAYMTYTTMTRLQIIGESAAIIWLVVATVVWRVRRGGSYRGTGAVLALAGAGAAAAALWQGKGWTYHFVPTVAFSVLLGVLALASPTDGILRRGQSAARLGATLMLVISWVPLMQSTYWQLTGGASRSNQPAIVEQRELEAEVARQSDAHSILVLSSDMTASQPWIVAIGLVNRNTFPHLWVPLVAYHTRWNGISRMRPRRPAEMSGAERAAFGAVTNGFTANPPDLLVVESRSKNERFTGYPGGFDHLAYYGQDPGFAACLGGYRPVVRTSGFQILRRRATESPPPGSVKRAAAQSRRCL